MHVLIIESDRVFAGLLKSDVETMLIKYDPQVTVAQDLDFAAGLLSTPRDHEFDLIICARYVESRNDEEKPEDNGLKMMTELVENRKITKLVGGQKPLTVIILTGKPPEVDDSELIYVVRWPMRPVKTLKHLQNILSRLYH